MPMAGDRGSVALPPPAPKVTEPQDTGHLRSEQGQGPSEAMGDHREALLSCPVQPLVSPPGQGETSSQPLHFAVMFLWVATVGKVHPGLKEQSQARLATWTPLRVTGTPPRHQL
jgi:hypothetical protein